MFFITNCLSKLSVCREAYQRAEYTYAIKPSTQFWSVFGCSAFTSFFVTGAFDWPKEHLLTTALVISVSWSLFLSAKICSERPELPTLIKIGIGIPSGFIGSLLVSRFVIPTLHKLANP